MTAPKGSSPCVCLPGRPNLLCARGRHRLAPGAEAFPPPDITTHGPWIGPDEPAPLEPGLCPGGLVAVLVDVDDTELVRWLLPAGVDPAATGGAPTAAAALASRPPGTVTIVLHDGDTGHPVARLASAPPS